MKKRYRLTRKSDFQRALDAGRLFSGQGLVAFARLAVRGAVGPRIGIAVSRQIRGAVLRNRARRRLREAVRLGLLESDSAALEGGIGYDVVLIARPAALSLPLLQLEAETRIAGERLSTLSPPRSSRP